MREATVETIVLNGTPTAPARIVLDNDPHWGGWGYTLVISDAAVASEIGFASEAAACDAALGEYVMRTLIDAPRPSRVRRVIDAIRRAL